MFWLILAVIFSLLYAALQFYYLHHWDQVKSISVPESHFPSKGVSIILVARNETDTIEACLRGILAQSYPAHLMEIIVIDDHSEDDTLKKVTTLYPHGIQIFSLAEYPDYHHPPAYKKSAISLGVDKATHDLIVVTDADCIQSSSWLKSVVYGFESSNAVFQTSPVMIIPEASRLVQMQEVELLMYAIITGAGIHSRLHDIANGANMAFSKKVFQAIKGFEGNYNYASGDDVFLLEKMRKQFPDRINFLKSKDATVFTHGKTSWAALLKQRLRWASKNNGLTNKSISYIWAFVGAYHVLLLSLSVMACLQFISWYPFLILLVFKWIADYFILQQAAAFFHRSSLLRNFFILQILYTGFILQLGVQILLGGKGDWERK